VPDLPLREVLSHVGTHVWTFLLAGGALVLAAFLVNRFAPLKRPRIKRTFILFSLYAVAEMCAASLHVAGAENAWMAFHAGARMLEAFTIINLIAIGLFDLGLPAISIVVMAFGTDMVVGVAYLASIVLILIDTGLNPASVLGASAVVSAVLAISLQSTLGNILGGIAFQLDGSVHVGDWIQLENGKQGKVREIRWRHTALETRDWDTIIVPNSVLLGQSFSILGRRTEQPLQHRMWVYFNVDFRYAPSQVTSVVTDALQAAPIPNVAAEPAAHAICMDFAKDTRDSFAYYAVRYWLTDLAKDDPTSSVVRSRIYTALRRAGIPLARPTSTTFVGTNEEDDDRSRMLRQQRRRLAAVESVELFRGLTEEERDFVASHLRYAPFAAGETVTRQGAVAHWLYILTSGKVEIRHAFDGKTTVLATVAAPGFFGEMGLMTGSPRTADVVALSDVECYRLDKEGFEKIVTGRPETVKELSETLAKRRMETINAEEQLDAGAQSVRQAQEQAAILGRIETFFGLKS